MSNKSSSGPLRILMLVDETPNGRCISYSKHPDALFSLHTVLQTLALSPRGPGQIEVTRAHRQVDRHWSRPDPRPVENFRFDDPDLNLNEYHQVWFFGLARWPTVSPLDQAPPGAPPPYLSGAELRILSAWMQRGGGVLAMGDHEDLGAALCGRIPRVRSMRLWRYSQGSVAPDNAPPINGPRRHDTLVKGNRYIDGRRRDHADLYTQDDECDDQPMRLHVERFGSGGPPSPHALLIDRDGAMIDVLPDHPHEGEVVVPGDLTQPMGFGVAGDEYPIVHGARLAPVIVAYGTVQPDHTAERDLNKGSAIPRSFGVVGAFDGHRAGVGRVVVDATWHHWFDMNLVGLPAGFPLQSDDQRKRLGFTSPENQGPEHLRRICRYFYNVADWLSPAGPHEQRVTERAEAGGDYLEIE